MTPERHARIKELFIAAAKVPRDERADWLRRECPEGDLRGEVEELLARHTDPTMPQTIAAEARGAVKGSAVVAEADGTATTALISSPGGRATDVEDRPAGTLIANRYRIVSKLGRGGMGIVYRADDTVLGQPVAIKFLPPEVAANPTAIARFRNEARLARTVTHPNVCRVHDIAEADGEQFITMEFVAGEDLASLLRRIGRLPNEKAIEVTRQTCAGLAAAHAVGVLHRDLKPANILLDSDGKVRLSDFGLAALGRELVDRERLAGTPAYMAPEQIRGVALSVRTDLYALGLVMYELFAGRPAFEGSSILEYLELQLNAQPAPLSSVAPGIPNEIDAVVDRCLRKDPGERPPSALHVAAALPGTDARWLASAADQTPDPELLAVVAAPSSAVGSRKWSAALAAVFLMGTVALRSIQPGPWDRPSAHQPSVLEDRAQQALQAAGVARGAHDAFGFCTHANAWRAVIRSFIVDTSIMDFLPADPAAPAFFYREGVTPLAATSTENVLWGSGLTTPNDPPSDGAGSRFVLLDGEGRLRAVWATPPLGDDVLSAQASEERWRPLLKLAGMPDASAIIPGRGAATQPLAECTSFSSQAQDAAADLLAIACAAPDHPLLFAVGTRANAVAASLGLAGDEVRRARIVNLAYRTMFIIAVLISLPTVYLAARAGKLDLRGAVRIGAIVAAAAFLAAVLRLGVGGPLFETISGLSSQMIRAAGVASAIALFYLAIDTHARRHWPHLLVTWNHLSVRGFFDPAVPHHILIGVCLGCFWAFIVAAERTLVNAIGWQARPPILEGQFAEKLLGPGSVVASLLSGIPTAVLAGLLILVILVALRSLLGKGLPAAIVSVILLAPVVIPRGAHPYTAWLALGIGFAGVCIWAAIRFGVLAVVVGLFVTPILITTPMSVDPESWLFPGSMVSLGLVVLLLGYGLWAHDAQSNPIPRRTSRLSPAEQ